MDYSTLSASDLFHRCATESDAAVWEEFVRRFTPVIARTVLRVVRRNSDCSTNLIEDLVQDTYLRICADDRRLLRTFVSRTEDSPYGFVKVVAASVALDFFKSRLAAKRAPELKADGIDDRIVGDERHGLTNALTLSERTILTEQIDRQLCMIVASGELQRSRTVFWLYFRAGLTASAIAALPSIGLTTKGVESLLFRLVRSMRLKFAERDQLDATNEKGTRLEESF